MTNYAVGVAGAYNEASTRGNFSSGRSDVTLTPATVANPAAFDLTTVTTATKAGHAILAQETANVLR